MKALITGAAGKMGGELAAAMAADYDLVYVDRAPADNLPEGTSYAVDLSEPTALPEIMATEKPDVIIHLASMLGGICEQQPKLAERVNVAATKLLGELAAQHGVQRFIFASTAAVYRQTKLAPTDEASNVDPASVYGQTKLRAEQALADIAAAAPGTLFVALRMFNVYGPRLTDSLVYKLTHATADAPAQVRCPDAFYRDYVHSTDVTKAFQLATEHSTSEPFAVYNIASGKPTTTGELIASLEAQGVDVHYAAEPGSPSYSWADIAAAKAHLGFAPHDGIIVDK